MTPRTDPSLIAILLAFTMILAAPFAAAAMNHAMKRTAEWSRRMADSMRGDR